MKKLAFILLLFSSFVNAQYANPVASQMSKQFIQADEYIGEDSMGFQYFIKNNILFKKKKAEFLQYKNPSLGKITKVDIQNPLRVILFYESFNTVIALDSQLNEVQKLNFSETNNNIIASGIGSASQNNLWVFNSVTQQLGLFSYTKNTYQTIGLVFEKGIKNYSSDFNYFYWIDQDNNFYSCDIFGKKKFIKKLPEFETVFISDDKLILLKNKEKLTFLNLENDKLIPVDNIEKSFKSFEYKNQNLAIFTTEGITNYKINLP
ncbi:hypothetical protein [Flavobacterium terrae]|uniref:Uncharacterized protein n=1 Tax=Flavobacterium terrae TaxID=415425 RepID=A0A1M6BPP8_9FLAO|nr:hypothetical protein [Flavobacterium terrae]SHI50513.1 hypothetical protein SAMN05444363_0869 [Flavobacterium terrae]